MRVRTVLVVLALALLSTGGQAQEGTTKPEHPAVNPGRPTITDPAPLTAPGWLECEIGVQRNLDKDLLLQTPFLLKLTSLNNRLEYRFATDGYDRFRDDTGQVVDGLGDMYASLHYLTTRQGKRSWDTAVRGTIKIPTASGRRGVGTGRTDYGFLLLASKDVTPSLHLDANLGYSALGKPGVGGFDNQGFTSISATIPIPHSRWSYTDEVAYFTGISGTGDQLTTMHGFSYAARPWDVWDVALQFGLSPDTPRYQILFGRTFFFGRVL